MEVVYLKNDGRCRWLDKQVLKKLFPEAAKATRNPFAPKRYIIIDWVSNDNGKVGFDLGWFKKLGVPSVETVKDLPKNEDFVVINTGYDSIVNEEKILLDRNIPIIDKPCPYVRKLRKHFEEIDDNYQYVLLCEANHIVVKNYATLFPKDMILVQMNNYKQRITEQSNGKPIKFISYVTFLKENSAEVFEFIKATFPDKEHDKPNTHCMWADSKFSPLFEIENLTEKELEGIRYACLINSLGSTNKSFVSMGEALTRKGLEVVTITSLKEFIRFKKKNDKEKVLLVKSPIPNDVEEPVLTYLEKGYFAALYVQFLDKTQIKNRYFRFINKAIRNKHLFFKFINPNYTVKNG